MENDETLSAKQIKAIFKEVVAEERNEFWIPQPEHYLDHVFLKNCRDGSETYRKNHEFISAIRSGKSWGEKIGVGVIVSSTLTFFGWAIWQAIKEAIK